MSDLSRMGARPYPLRHTRRVPVARLRHADGTSLPAGELTRAEAPNGAAAQRGATGGNRRTRSLNSFWSPSGEESGSGPGKRRQSDTVVLARPLNATHTDVW